MYLGLDGVPGLDGPPGEQGLRGVPGQPGVLNKLQAISIWLIMLLNIDNKY